MRDLTIKQRILTMRTHKLCIAAAIALIISGCGAKDTSNASAKEQTANADNATLKSGIDTLGMDTTVRPGDDFFAYANGKAIAELEIPADKGSFGVFTQLRDESDANVRIIIEEAAAGEFAEGSDQQRVGDLYNSFLDWETRDTLGMAPIAPYLQQIDTMTSHDEVFAFFGVGSRMLFSSPVEMFQYADAKQSDVYGMYLDQGGLGLPDREYYLKEGDEAEATRQAYRAYMLELHELAGQDLTADEMQGIYDLEHAIAQLHMPKEQARRWSDNYVGMPEEELPSLVPGVNWSGFLEAFGLSNPGYLISLSTDYFNALGSLITETPVEDWKRYLRWQVLNAQATRLTRAMDDRHFAFYGTTLRGIEEQRPEWQRAVLATNSTLGELVGKVYVEQHFPPAAKARMEELVANLIAAYKESVVGLDWMSDATKQEALDKLSKFTPMIGYPEKFRDYAGAEIKADDYFGNRIRLTEANIERDIARHRGTVDRTEWGMTPQTVNAYYSSVLNVIVFPAAILQPPFFDMSADDAVNYGAIGAVIGHEIGHGLDDSGRKFDGDGNIRDWWTEEDGEKFDAKTHALIAQYDSYCPLENTCVNGEFTLGENIGDLGGISIALKAYQASLGGKEPPVIDGFTGLQRVFLGFGQVWRNKYRDESLETLIATDPHAPSMYRANGSVRNVPEWYTAFDVGTEDALYLSPEARVKIW